MAVPAITLGGLAEQLLAQPAGRRTIIAIAGPPGSGKSTMSERLVKRLQKADPGRAVLVPMDGFHYDDGLLRALGRHARKGAPDTFDVGGLASVLRRLRARDEETVAVPVFDRDLEISRGSARLVPQATDLIVVEGNYLLLRHPPWSALAPLFDLRILIRTPEKALRERLSRRWEGYGLTPDQIRDKLELNDLPNGRLVMDESTGYDLVLGT
jgi:pantothenate kinase